QQFLALRQRGVLSLAFSPDGMRVALGAPEYVDILDAGRPGPDDPWLAAAWFQYHVGHKQWDQAGAALVRLDQKLPGDADLWWTAGRAYFDAGRWDQAAAAFARAVQLGDGHAAACQDNIGHCHFRQRRWEKAIVAHSEAIRLEPGRTGPR